MAYVSASYGVNVMGKNVDGISDRIEAMSKLNRMRSLSGEEGFKINDAIMVKGTYYDSKRKGPFRVVSIDNNGVPYYHSRVLKSLQDAEKPTCVGSYIKGKYGFWKFQPKDVEMMNKEEMILGELRDSFCKGEFCLIWNKMTYVEKEEVNNNRGFFEDLLGMFR